MISVVVISKDEAALDHTLEALAAERRSSGLETETLVIDASVRRLEPIRLRHTDVRWIDFEQPAGVRVSIPHQRNAGVAEARGDLIVFTDCGCIPHEGWLHELVQPILAGEATVTAGAAPSPNAGEGSIYDASFAARAETAELYECATINVAFTRSAYDTVGGFDESFEYGSDIDFSWRLVDAGHRIHYRPRAVVETDWGSGRRQLKRGYQYGQARARLYRKHPHRLHTVWRRDPIALAYPLFLLGLPLTLRFKLYPALLAIPAWRNRHSGAGAVLSDHLAFGAGVLREMARR